MRSKVRLDAENGSGNSTPPEKLENSGEVARETLRGRKEKKNFHLSMKQEVSISSSLPLTFLVLFHQQKGGTLKLISVILALSDDYKMIMTSYLKDIVSAI